MTTSKIRGLHRLITHGADVPPFRVVPDPGSDLPPLARVRAEVGAAFEAIAGRAQYGCSLRSAASDEDTTSASAAGRYRSFNGPVGLDAVCDAVLAIWRHHRSIAPPGGTCPLILQATHCSAFGGVLAMPPPKDGDEKGMRRCSVEAYYGSCRSTVDGLGVPYRSAHDAGGWRHAFASSLTKSRFAAHAALFEPVDGDMSGGRRLVPRTVPFPREVRVYRETSHLELDLYGFRPAAPPGWYLSSVLPQLLTLASALGAEEGVDMEWGCSMDGTLALYQVRPLNRPLPPAATLAAPARLETSPAGTTILTGLPASPGKARGKIRVPGAGAASGAGILFLGDGSACDAQELQASAGVVTTFGGVLSHVAIACRELRIPCVAGIGALLAANRRVEIDGDRGTVKLLQPA